MKENIYRSAQYPVDREERLSGKDREKFNRQVVVNPTRSHYPNSYKGITDFFPDVVIDYDDRYLEFERYWDVVETPKTPYVIYVPKTIRIAQPGAFSTKGSEEPMTLRQGLCLAEQYPEAIDETPLVLPGSKVMYYDIPSWHPALVRKEGRIHITVESDYTSEESTYRIGTRGKRIDIIPTNEQIFKNF